MNSSSEAVNAAILIGGKSSRMGCPKSLLEFGRLSLLEKIAAAADEVASEVVLVGDGPVPAVLAGKKRLPDVPGIAGPLAGILAAFRWRPGAAWIVLSCDLPFVSGDALRWLLEQRRPDCLGVLPCLDSPETPEPLLAVYAPSARTAIEEAARRGERSIRRILSREAVLTPKVPKHLRRAWTNVNTPQEWKAALEEAAKCR